MNRNRIIAIVAIGVAAVALGWALMAGLSRVLRDNAGLTPAADAPPPQTTPSAEPAVPKIKATLFFGSEDGRSLVPWSRRSRWPKATWRRRARSSRRSSPPRRPNRWPPTVPAGTKLRGLYVSDRNEAFVDLDAAVRDKHPGGSMNELFTVYTIVNAITTNLPDVQTRAAPDRRPRSRHARRSCGLAPPVTEE